MPCAFDSEDPFERVRQLQEQVRVQGACSLPGVSIVYDRFLHILGRAVSRGFVCAKHAEFVAKGLWHGFDCGINVSLLKGRRRFRNYASALEARPQVTKATRGRVLAGKTLALCRVALDYSVSSLSPLIPFDDWRIFPIGAVPKPLEPSEVRPVSDHTKSGIKAATDDEGLRHSLTALQDIERELKFGYSMVVGDIDAAYPLLPLAWWIWPFFMFVWFDVDVSDAVDVMRLYMHVTGDFGTSGLPGTFKIFFTDVVVGMARSESVLTLPLAVYVDDCSLMGRFQRFLMREWNDFKSFLEALGIFMKQIKERAAAMVQLVLGFWWDSVLRSRTLEAKKLASYREMLSDFSERKVLSLTERQRVAGRMQRAVMTLPPGASCLLASVYAMMAGLTLGFQRRRTSRLERADYLLVHDLLGLNLGKGYFSYDQFDRAPPVWTDASKSRRYAGGGYVSACGAYRFWHYGSSAARKPIDFLEGDAVVVAVQDLGPGWRHCVVPIYLDNTSFERSAVKGWSHAARLQLLLRRLFSLALKFECVFEFHWLSTHDNVHADALSRDAESYFLSRVYVDGIWAVGPCRRHSDCGALRCIGKEYSADVAGDGPPRRSAPEMVMAISFPRCSLFDGLPVALHPLVDDFLDNRLGSSSMRTVDSALAKWDVVVRRYGWDRVIRSDDPCRGGKLTTFVVHMVEDTSLHWESIRSYVWGLRSWVKLQRQVDPIFGVYGWQDFMASIQVHTWQVNEPRKQVPVALLRRALEAVDRRDFESVQVAVLVLILFFSFSRSETPCAATLDGFDLSKHMSVADLRVSQWAGKNCVMVRLKRIKQDPRMERPEASGNEDWVTIGDVPDDPTFSIFFWLRLLFSFHGERRPDNSPFFVHVSRDTNQPLTYSAALTQFRRFLQKVTTKEEAESYGLHGLRVAGWNGARRGPAGDELAVAHGGWHNGSQHRYDRFSADEVLSLPRHVLEGADASLPLLQRAAAPVPPRPSSSVAPAAAVISLPSSSAKRSGKSSTASVPAAPCRPVPDGWSKEVRRGRTKVYSVYRGPGGHVCYSVPAVHRYISSISSVTRSRPARLPTPRDASPRVEVDPADGIPGMPPPESRCGACRQGCTVLSINGSHAGLCSHMVVERPRKRS